jgi:hypothetical protein
MHGIQSRRSVKPYLMVAPFYIVTLASLAYITWRFL